MGMFLQSGDGRLNFGKAGDRQQRGVQSAEAHLTDHLRLAAHLAAGIDAQVHAAARSLAPFFAQFQEHPVIRGAFRRKRAERGVDRCGEN